MRKSLLFCYMVISAIGFKPILANMPLPDNQDLKEILSVSTESDSVYVETILQGFAKLSQGARQLLDGGHHVIAGAHSLVEGIAELTVCAIRERGNNQENKELISHVEDLLSDFDYKLITLINSYAKDVIHTEQGAHNLNKNTNKRFSIFGGSEEAPSDSSQELESSNNTSAISSDSSVSESPKEDVASSNAIKQEEEKQQKEMAEGLSEIFYNMFCMLINPDNVGLYLKKSLSGLLKIISVILADGKIDRKDLERISAALVSLFNFTGNSSNSDTSNSDSATEPDNGNPVANRVGINFDSSKFNLDPDIRRILGITRNEFEKAQMSEGVALIFKSIMSIIIDPGNVGSHLGNIMKGIMHVFASIFADGKVDAHDLNNLSSVISGKRSIDLEANNSSSEDSSNSLDNNNLSNVLASAAIS